MSVLLRKLAHNDSLNKPKRIQMLYAKLKHMLFRYYGMGMVLVFVAATLWFIKSPKEKDEIAVFLSIVGGLFSFLYFIQKQKLEELNLFKDLFTTFNQKYSALNDDLNQIVREETDKPLTTKEENLLNDYFNLCAEEFLFYRKGYIYPEVWKAWRNGIYFYLNNERIKKHWIKEKASNSYYGLENELQLKKDKEIAVAKSSLVQEKL
jgi:hypothetical protein